MQIEALEQTAETVSDLMKLLANPSRLMILCQLVEAERSVGELCARVGMKAPAMSQQLAILRREGAVAARRDGQTIYYSLGDPRLVSLMGFLHETFCDPSIEGTKSHA